MKNRISFVIFLLVLLSITSSCEKNQSKGYVGFREGFQDFTWGDDIESVEQVYVEYRTNRGDEDEYTINYHVYDEEFAEVPANYEFNFFNYKLYYVTITFKIGKDNQYLQSLKRGPMGYVVERNMHLNEYRRIKGMLVMKYGVPASVVEKADIKGASWETKETTITFILMLRDTGSIMLLMYGCNDLMAERKKQNLTDEIIDRLNDFDKQQDDL